MTANYTRYYPPLVWTITVGLAMWSIVPQVFVWAFWTILVTLIGLGMYYAGSKWTLTTA